MAGTRAKAPAKMQAAHGYWRPLLSCSSPPTKVDCSWFRPSSIPRSCMARKCGHDEGGQRQDVSGRKESSVQPCIPETALLTFCTGTLGYFHPVYSLMLPNCVGSTDARTWRLADGPRRRCDSHSRVAVVSAGLRWARTGAVMSNPLLSRSSTLNIAKVTAQARVNQPCGSATPQSRITRRRT
jgi:hypothetical protein